MISLQEVHEYGTELEQWLRMRVHPVAVKMLKSREEVPEGAIIPTRDWGYKYALCQSFAKSQRDGLTIARSLRNDCQVARRTPCNVGAVNHQGKTKGARTGAFVVIVQ